MRAGSKNTAKGEKGLEKLGQKLGASPSSGLSVLPNCKAQPIEDGVFEVKDGLRGERGAREACRAAAS